MTIMGWEFARRIEESMQRNLTEKSFEAIAERFDSQRSYQREPLFLEMKDLVDTVPPRKVVEFMEKNEYLILSKDPKPEYHPLMNKYLKPKPLTQSEGQIPVKNWNL